VLAQEKRQADREEEDQDDRARELGQQQGDRAGAPS